MAFLAADLDLEKLWRDRSQLPDFKLRDEAYKQYQNAYLSRTADGEQQNITWRPIMLDGQQADTRGREPINLTKQIGLHHTATSARPPRVWNEAGAVETEDVALKNTVLIVRALRDSRIKLLQTSQAANLAVRGDACYGVMWDTGKRAQRHVWVKVVKPDYCYPSIDDAENPGCVRDMLISYEVRKGWAERNYGVTIPENKSTVRVFEYWDEERRLVQVEKVKVGNWTLEHNLGFVPWYWCFNQVPGMFAQADVAETPKIQGILNELMLLGEDAMRRAVDLAYYAVGYKGTITPQPGKAIGFPNPNTRIDQFPTGAPPDLIMQFMSFVRSHGESMAGISPISSEGMAQGSIVTGAAVRHQVEAIEARTQAKRTNLEAAYSWMGESILRIIRDKMPSAEFTLRVGREDLQHAGSEIGEWTQCEASYGSFEGLDTMQRGNWAMQGLGRVHGRRTAIQLAYPDRDTDAMEREIDAYQLAQAELSAQAQAKAQQVVQAGAGPESSPGQTGGTGAAPPGPQMTTPQIQQHPPMPSGSQLGMATVSDLKLLLRLVVEQLKGDVYATGEMAITGMAMLPTVAVTRQADQALVQSALASKRATVSTSLGEDEPRIQLND